MSLLLAFATEKERAAALGALGCPKPGASGASGASGKSGALCPMIPWTRNGRDFLVLVAGVGPVAAALRLGAALASRPDIQGCLNLGVAGSFDPERAPLGACVAATAEIYPEYGVRASGVVDAAAIRLPQLVTQKGAAYDEIALDPETAAKAMGLHLPGGLLRGKSLTVAGVTAEAEAAAAFRDRYGVLTENMEGFALAMGCEAAGIPFLEARVISNPVGPRGVTDWDLPGALAGLGALFLALTD